MGAVTDRLRQSVPAGVVAAVSLALLLSGCARTVTGAANTPSPAPSSTAVITPSAPMTPSAPVTPAAPVDPLQTLSASTKKEFKGCLLKDVGPGSGGKCAALVIKKLKQAGFYPWKASSVITTAGANALLNYQRSRGITGTARTGKATWVALATKAPAVPMTLPSKCTTTKGIILCVDQAHRKLFWIKNGKVVKTFKVRLGGWTYLKKKGAKQAEWRIYPTANGTWKVYDKQVDPASENYGSGAMPYSTMFYPDMYVHYSPGFHSDGYAKSSHGCVNIGQLSEAKWIFSHTPIGTPVYIYSLKAPAPAVSVPPANSPTAGPSSTPTS